MALIVVRISTSNWSNWGLHFSKSISTIRSLFFFGFIGAWRALLKLELREKFSTDEVVWIEASLTIQGCSSGFTRNASKKVWCQTWTRTNLKNLYKQINNFMHLPSPFPTNPSRHRVRSWSGLQESLRALHFPKHVGISRLAINSWHSDALSIDIVLTARRIIKKRVPKGWPRPTDWHTRRKRSQTSHCVCVWLRRMSHVAKKKLCAQ